MVGRDTKQARSSGKVGQSNGKSSGSNGIARILSSLGASSTKPMEKWLQGGKDLRKEPLRPLRFRVSPTAENFPVVFRLVRNRLRVSVRDHLAKPTTVSLQVFLARHVSSCRSTSSGNGCNKDVC